MNVTIPMRYIRAIGLNALPEEGSWVAIKGNPYAPRGKRIPDSIKAEGVQHLDMYYAYDEECPWTMPLKQRQLIDERLANGGFKEGELEDIIEGWLDQSFILGNNGMQRTWMTVHTGSSKLIRFWCGEVATFPEELIKEMINTGLIETRTFSKIENNPVWDDATKDLIGSLMIDGLTLQAAQDELIKAGEKFQRKTGGYPNYFYRPIGMYRAQFCEEDE